MGLTATIDSTTVAGAAGMGGAAGTMAGMVTGAMPALPEMAVGMAVGATVLQVTAGMAASVGMAAATGKRPLGRAMPP
jgi:hypothetical protein